MEKPELLGEMPESTWEDGDERIFSFIIKVFLAPHPRHQGSLRWRGKLTFVPEGEVRMVASLGALVLIIHQRLEQKGVWFHSFCRLLFKIYRFFARSGC